MDGNAPIAFTLTHRTAAQQWMTDRLRRFNYWHGTPANKGLLRRYLAKVTGLSQAQGYPRHQAVLYGMRYYRPPAKPFARRYTDADIRLSAEVGALHGTLSGPATRKLCERMYHVYGETRFERLATTSALPSCSLGHVNTYGAHRRSGRNG